MWMCNEVACYSEFMALCFGGGVFDAARES